jgi:hypothetical protein
MHDTLGVLQVHLLLILFIYLFLDLITFSPERITTSPNAHTTVTNCDIPIWRSLSSKHALIPVTRTANFSGQPHQQSLLTRQCVC